MKVLLVDVDSKIPNLALMQISAWHKARGDKVGFDIDNPKLIYISCIFKKNANQARGIATMYPEAKTIMGGSGISWAWLPANMRMNRPDYDLYPSEYSMGFTTRGCIRRCPFCIVKDKEGPIQKWQHIKEWHDDGFDTAMLLDNNILALPEWAKEQFLWIIDHDIKIVENGMDIRLLTPITVQLLREIRWAKGLKFAWDNITDEQAVFDGLKMLRDGGFNPRREIQIYVLVGYNTTIEQDIYRCQKLKDFGTNAFVMQYKKDVQTNALARWANRKWAYWSTDFKDYTRKVK